MSYTLSVHQDGRVIVTVPRFVTIGMVEEFLKKKKRWLQKILSTTPKNENVWNREHYLQHKEAARVFIEERLRILNELHYNFQYKRVSVRTNTSRWGSCSELGNLNFDYRILFLAPPLQDYLLVHELCHLREMNHSSRFWKLVEQAVPQYRDIRAELKQIAL